MSEAKQTAEKWVLREEPVTYLLNGESTYEVSSPSRVFWVAHALQRQDAHLIAAAPRMYEALKNIVGAVELHGADGIAFFDARNDALAAIVQAEGRES